MFRLNEPVSLADCIHDEARKRHPEYDGRRAA